MPGYEFQLESKLLEEAPGLHQVFSDNVLACQNMLIKYKSLFPNYTDHTVLHSLEVIAFCNELIGDNIRLLNADEIFILLMAAYLHDSGMGINKRDYEMFLDEVPGAKAYRDAHPEESLSDIVRIFHNEFSGCYIRKYAQIFDFPSEKHLFAVIEVSRGHRKTDLFDEVQYPASFTLENGNEVRLPYLTALMRLADELDIAADRNIQFTYSLDRITSEAGRREFRKHKAIRQLEIACDRFIVHLDDSDIEIRNDLKELFRKLQSTLEYCCRVVKERTPFTIGQTSIEIIKE